MNADGNQLLLRGCRILPERVSPLWMCVHSANVVRRKDSDGVRRLAHRLVHSKEPVARELPGLDDDAEACLFQLPRDPVGPLPIFRGVADEEVSHANGVDGTSSRPNTHYAI